MRFYQPVVIEESLGKILRRARETAGITVDDAVYRAKLPRAVVEALEADDFGHFASPLYARSFLRQYGDYIHVDVSPWINDLVPTTLIDSEAIEAFIDLTDRTTLPDIRGKKKSKNPGGGAMAAVWLILITGAVVWGGIEIIKRLDDKLSAPTPAPQQAATPKPAPPGTAPAEPGKTPTPAPEPETPRAIIVNE